MVMPGVGLTRGKRVGGDARGVEAPPGAPPGALPARLLRCPDPWPSLASQTHHPRTTHPGLACPSLVSTARNARGGTKRIRECTGNIVVYVPVCIQTQDVCTPVRRPCLGPATKQLKHAMRCYCCCGSLMPGAIASYAPPRAYIHHLLHGGCVCACT